MCVVAWSKKALGGAHGGVQRGAGIKAVCPNGPRLIGRRESLLGSRELVALDKGKCWPRGTSESGVVGSFGRVRWKWSLQVRFLVSEKAEEWILLSREGCEAGVT